MTHHPIDLPDEPRPSIPDAYRVYPASLDSYRGYRAEYPTPGQAWAAVAMILFVVLGLIGALFAWALA